VLEELSGFTLFVLGVSIVLSFVLRKLIQEIQQMKEGLALELQELTSQLVEENPSLEKYQQLGVLYFRLDQFQKSLDTFDYLLSQGVFEREAHFYRVLCLLNLNRKEEALGLFQRLQLPSYTKEEIDQLKGAVHRKTSMLRWGELFLKILLTNVSFQVGADLEAGKNSKDAELNRILTHLPTRYGDVSLVDEKEDSWIFRCKDRHLERTVRLHVTKDGLGEPEIGSFLMHPRILAQIHNRTFPQVYDLQRSAITFYSQEEFEGDSLLVVFGEYRSRSRSQEFVNIWIVILTHVEYLGQRNVRLQRFRLNEIGYDRRKDRLFFLGALVELTTRDSLEWRKQVRQVLIQSLDEFIKYQDRIPEELQELSIKLKVSTKEVDLDSFIRFLEDAQRSMVSWQESSSKAYLQQLMQLEKIHRSSIHGLKGKFSIVGRYSDEPSKLLKTFYRVSNLDDVKEKILHLMELIAQLESMMSAGFFPICGEIREVDYIAFIDQLESFSRMNFEDPQTRLELAHDFLKVQNGLFEELSDKLAGFITEHEVSLPRFLEEFLQGVSDRKRIELEIQPDAGSLKVCVMEREGFLDKMKLIMENLLNNALEAGAESVQVRVYSPEPGTVNLDLKDDGPGIPPEILEELERQETYSLGEGGTGLIASKNACEILGGHLWINPEPMARGTLIRLALMAYLA
jgi:signal transduction histidine kinase